ncbi:MAG: hypothetical protein NTZ67_00130 [Gammaproteobacteria bacterium]|nr:hypothetical protein [Gammaproteobacteria bacterium]
MRSTLEKIIDYLKIEDYQGFKKNLKKIIMEDTSDKSGIKERALLLLEKQKLEQDTEKLTLVSVAIVLYRNNFFSEAIFNTLFLNNPPNISNACAENYFPSDAVMAYCEVRSDLLYPRKSEGAEKTIMEQAYDAVTSITAIMSEHSQSTINNIGLFLRQTKNTRETATQTTEESMNTLTASSHSQPQQ